MQGLRSGCWDHCIPLAVTEGPVFLLAPRVLLLGLLGKASLIQNLCYPKGSLTCMSPEQRGPRPKYPHPPAFFPPLGLENSVLGEGGHGGAVS